MILDNSASSCGRLICNRPTLLPGKNGDGRQESVWGHQKAQSHLGPEGTIFQRERTLRCEPDICHLKQFFSSGHLMIQDSRIVVKKKENRQSVHYQLIQWFHKISLIAAKYRLLAVIRKVLTKLSQWASPWCHAWPSSGVVHFLLNHNQNWIFKSLTKTNIVS